MAAHVRVVRPDEPTEPPLTGREAMLQVGQLLDELLPRVPLDDPIAPHLRLLRDAALPRRLRGTPA